MINHIISLFLPLHLIMHGLLSMWIMLDIKLSDLTFKRAVAGFSYIAFVFFSNILMLFCYTSLYTKIYFLLVQIPLYIAFRILSDKKGCKLLFVVLYTIALCVPLTSLTYFISYFFSEMYVARLIVRLTLSPLILFLIYRYIRPVLSYMYKFQKTTWGLYCIVLLLWTIAHYKLTGYNYEKQHLISQISIVFPMVLALYVTLYITMLQFKQTRNAMLKENELIAANTRIEAITEHTNQIKETLNQTSIYRHDLKHHVIVLEQYLSSKEYDKAYDYLSEINDNLSKISIKNYCKNYTINAVLSHYISKAHEKHITVNTKINIPEDINIPLGDLSVIFANSIENAINAQENTSEKIIDIYGYIENNKIFIEVKNNYTNEIKFENNIPITTSKGHGYGTKSIVFLVEKYNGQVSFNIEDNMFVFRCCI